MEAEKLRFLGQMQMETFVMIGISSSIWNLFNTILLPSKNEIDFTIPGSSVPLEKVISGWQIPHSYMANFGGFSELVLKKCAHSPLLSLLPLTKINLTWYLSLPLHYCFLCNKIKGHWNNTQTPKNESQRRKCFSGNGVSIIIVKVDYYYRYSEQIVLLLKNNSFLHLLTCTGLFRHESIWHLQWSH